MIDKVILLPYIQELRESINEEYYRSSRLVSLRGFGENEFNVFDLDVDNLLIIIKDLIDNIILCVNADELTDEVIMWIEKMLETDVITFRRYIMRIVHLQKLAKDYPGEYEEVLSRLYTSLAVKIVNSYINKVKMQDNDFISYMGVSLK